MKLKFVFVPRLYTTKKPYYPPSHGLLPPLGLAILKSSLEKNNYKVDIDDLDIKVFRHNQNSKGDKRIDLEIFDDKELVKKYFKGNFQELEREAEKILSMTSIKGYDIIGLSLLGDSNFSTISMAMILAKLIKKKTGAIVVVGGISSPRPLIEVKELSKNEYVDHVITNGGEEPLLKLLYAIENNLLGKVSIDNVYTNDKDTSKKKLLHKFFCPTQDFVLPNFDGLPMDLYRVYPNEKNKKDSVLMLPYIFIRGCLNKCIFCPLSADNYFVAKKPELVATELNNLSNKYKTKYFFFINTHVNPSTKYLNELYTEFKKQDVNILWTDCANFKFMDKTSLLKLKEMGAVRLVFGLESASNPILKRINKGITVQKAEALLKQSHKLGIWNELEFVLGLPYETDLDIKNTVDFMKKNKQYINFYHLNRFILMDGSLYDKYPEKYGLTNSTPLANTVYDMQQFTKKFDEINGLRWPDKLKQINKSFERLDLEMRNQQKNQRISYHSNVHMANLFWLYDNFDKKSQVLKYMRDKKLK